MIVVWEDAYTAYHQLEVLIQAISILVSLKAKMATPPERGNSKKKTQLLTLSAVLIFSSVLYICVNNSILTIVSVQTIG